MINVSIDRVVTRRIRNRMRHVARNLGRAQAAAINRTITGTIAQGSKLIRSEVNVKAARIKKNIKKDRATAGRPTGYFDVSGAHVPVSDMGARQTRAGVTYKRYRSGGRMLIKGAFIATVGRLKPGRESSGHRGVFRREGKKRLPINEQWGPSIMAIWQHREDRINLYAVGRLNRELIHQIEYYRSRG